MHGRPMASIRVRTTSVNSSRVRPARVTLRQRAGCCAPVRVARLTLVIAAQSLRRHRQPARVLWTGRAGGRRGSCRRHRARPISGIACFLLPFRVGRGRHRATGRCRGAPEADRAAAIAGSMQVARPPRRTTGGICDHSWGCEGAGVLCRRITRRTGASASRRKRSVKRRSWVGQRLAGGRMRWRCSCMDRRKRPGASPARDRGHRSAVVRAVCWSNHAIFCFRGTGCATPRVR